MSYTSASGFSLSGLAFKILARPQLAATGDGSSNSLQWSATYATGGMQEFSLVETLERKHT
jgi:hypothetical protein